MNYRSLWFSYNMYQCYIVPSHQSTLLMLRHAFETVLNPNVILRGVNTGLQYIMVPDWILSKYQLLHCYFTICIGSRLHIIKVQIVTLLHCNMYWYKIAYYQSTNCYIVTWQYVLVLDWILSKYKLLHCLVRSVALKCSDLRLITLHEATSHHYICAITSLYHYICAITSPMVIHHNITLKTASRAVKSLKNLYFLVRRWELHEKKRQNIVSRENSKFLSKCIAWYYVTYIYIFNSLLLIVW